MMGFFLSLRLGGHHVFRAPSIQLEDSTYLLLENGSRMLLE
jgi:hypothetical protein